MSGKLDQDIESILLSEQDIKDIVTRLGKELSADYADKDPLVIAVLRGAFVFTADLARAITVPASFDFMAVSSYGSHTKSSGVLRIVKDLDTDIEGRHVIIADDILDSGLTLSRLITMLEERKPASLRVCAFAVKDVPRESWVVEPAYVGTHVPDAFIVGYGLDYAEHYRNLPYVGVLSPEVYQQ